MLLEDEIRLFVVDAEGKEVESHAVVQFSGGLGIGTEIALRLAGPGGPERRFRVLGVRPGEGRGRFVQVVELG